MITQETYTLSNDVKIPKLGLGTWFIEDKDVVQVVKDAVDLGYRHIDTAQAYQNERGVGEAIRACGVPREELFVTSKLAAEVKNYPDAVASIDKSLETMGLDYLDMMIIHSPQPWKEFRGDDKYYEGNRAAWKALEEAYQAGKLRAIGVSNFLQADLENILQSCTVKPMVNQILAHISHMPTDLIRFSQSHDILVEGYSPVAHGGLMKHDKVVEIAKAYDVSVPQLAVRYLLQKGLLPLPKSAKKAHIQNNADVDFEISEQDMATLDQAERVKDYGDANQMPVFQE
ncbi:MAG: aldo/keto reductase [Puniceicoccaceae bacterium 5H]|nr:MAG: aldo/keto reductase [Puniceicoccaceae bacterium 5H]